MILSLISLVFAKDDLVLKDDLLTNHVFLTIYTDDWLNSVQVCLDEPRCIAYNFKINWSKVDSKIFATGMTH